MKKIISIAIVLALVFAFASPALAEPVRPVEFTLDAEISNANQLIVSVSVSENSGFTSGAFNINFEEGILKCVNYIKTDSDLGIASFDGTNDGRVRVIFFATPALIEGGEMLKVVFDFVDPAFIGTIDLGLEITELLIGTDSNVESESSGCTIEVTEHPEVTEPAITAPPQVTEQIRPIELSTYAEISNANQLIVTVSVSEKGGFTSGGFDLDFEMGILKYVKVLRTDIELGLVNANGANDGRVRVSFAKGKDPVNEGGEMLKVVFDFVDPEFVGTINFDLEIREFIEPDTITKIEAVATGYTIEITEHPEVTEPAITAPPTNAPANTPKPTNEPISPPDDENDVDSTYAPTTPATGGMTLIVIAAISAVAGVGALAIRKKD